MTPGTAAARRKTVSFGAHVQDNEGKRQGKSGLPDSCPGKFPSPFVKPTEIVEGQTDAAYKSRGRNKLTEKLELVREESAKRKSTSFRQDTEPIKETNAESDFAEHAPEHWRIMFEQYRERSERECRKLVSKQRAAKSFAREKDVQLMETADQLRQEKKKVDRLERQVAELQAELKGYQEELRASQAEEQSAKEEATRLKRGSGLTGYRRHGDFPTSATSRTQESEKPAHETTSRSRPSRERLPSCDAKNEPPKNASVDANEAEPSRSRVRNRQSQKREHDDVWAPSLASSSLIPSKPEVVRPASSPKISQTNAAPLKSVDINTLPQESFSVAMSMGLQPPSPQRETRSDSPMHSPTRSQSKPTENLSITIPESSTFLPDAEQERPNVLTGTPVPIRSPIRSPLLSPARSPKRAVASIMKEKNSSTVRASRRSQRENMDPKSPAPVQVVEKGDMDDVMKEARQRLAARGRNVS